jgi:nucleoside-diphosphate-sugar epimerase
MKNILITGKDSYIGKSVERWLLQTPDCFRVETLDVKSEEWKNYDFSKHDVVFHVAGIAHINEKKANEELYFKVNRDLAYLVAKKAKEAGVKQFVFLSSMSVYGLDNGVIDIDTSIQPNTAYGKSKFEAEVLINELNDDTFTIAVLRPPVVYGRECKGNYPKLASFALKTPIFPNVHNKRSMIYIDNLSEFIKHIILDKSEGLYFPQNSEYVETSEMVKMIAEVHGKQIILTKIFNFILSIAKIKYVNKAFGNLVYDMQMSEYKVEYRVFTFKESIFMTEGQSNE